MRRTIYSAAAFVALVMGVPCCLYGQTEILIGDFEGGLPLGGWTLADNTASTPWGPGAFDIVEEAGGNRVLRMHYTGSELQPPGTALTPLVSLWNDSFVNPRYFDGYLRVQVRVDAPNALGSLARGDLSFGNGYTLSMVALDEGIDHEKAGHQFHIDRFENGVPTLKWLSGRDNSIEFDLGDWWNMELGVIGATISARVWEVGTPEPPEPQFAWTDPSRLPGFQIGLYSLVQSEVMPVPSRADASFDNVYFMVPEPAGIMLAVGALLSACLLRPRRTSWTLCCALGMVCLSTATLHASESFRDDFTNPDPTSPDREPVTWFAGADDNPPSISNGQLIVEDSDWTVSAGVEGFTARNLVVEAQFQVLTGTQGGVILRINPAITVGYHSHIRGSTHPDYPNTADIWRDSGDDLTQLTGFMDIDFDPDGVVVMRLEAIRDSLSLWVWPAGTAQPQQPIATAQDITWTDGTVGLHVADVDNQPPLLARMAVDYFEVTVFPNGDFDFDGDVDGDDFPIWQTGFNVDDRGDADGDGDTDGDDFLIWQTGFGSGNGAASAVVPEPAQFGCSSCLQLPSVASECHGSGANEDVPGDVKATTWD